MGVGRAPSASASPPGPRSARAGPWRWPRRAGSASLQPQQIPSFCVREPSFLLHGSVPRVTHLQKARRARACFCGKGQPRLPDASVFIQGPLEGRASRPSAWCLGARLAEGAFPPFVRSGEVTSRISPEGTESAAPRGRPTLSRGFGSSPLPVRGLDPTGDPGPGLSMGSTPAFPGVFCFGSW